MRCFAASAAAVLAVIAATATVASAQDAAPPRSSLEEQFQALNLADARKWQMFLDIAQHQKAELVERPVFVWTNPTKNKGQHGAVFVWTFESRPIVVGSIFVDCTLAAQRIMHEFHSLST